MKSFKVFFIALFFQSIAANLVHPVTPTLILKLNLPSYMFGLAFASMSFTNLFFSPFWGKLNGYIGSRKIICICCIGYGIGQFVFFKSTTPLEIVIARLLSGFFVGGIVVSQMTYITKRSINVSKDLTIFATVQAVASATGYFVGGIIGKWNINIVFILQVIMLISLGFVFRIIMDRNSDRTISCKTATSIFLKNNPINYFYTLKPFMNKVLGILSVIVFLSMIGTTCQDQNFNFFINDVYFLDSSYNGYIKSVVAILGLFLNVTLCRKIIKNRDIGKSLRYLFFVIGLNVLIIFFIKTPTIFIGFNVLFYALNIVYTPLLQYLFTQSNMKIERGVLMGFYNSLKSLGMICGSLMAGMLYVFGEKTPFIFTTVIFIVSAMLMLVVKNEKSLDVKNSV
ncbi:MAG: MFS transporter [Lachnospirales bacterium]